MADPQVLGDYDPEEVTFSLTGTKSGTEINPQHCGPDTRITVAGLARSESTEGMGGSVVRSRLHSTLAPLSFVLMSSDPAVKQLSDLMDTGEIFTFSIVDNSGSDSQVSGKCWAQTSPDWNRNRVDEPVTFTFESQVPRGALRHGQRNIV